MLHYEFLTYSILVKGVFWYKSSAFFNKNIFNILMILQAGGETGMVRVFHRLGSSIHTKRSPAPLPCHRLRTCFQL